MLAGLGTAEHRALEVAKLFQLLDHLAYTIDAHAEIAR